jgi:tripartite-type tricarboxylate transporter receptor subunit TctC
LERHCADAVKSEVVRQIIANTGQSIRYLNGAAFRAQTMADYQFKGALIRRLGLGAQ